MQKSDELSLAVTIAGGEPTSLILVALSLPCCLSHVFHVQSDVELV